MAYRTGWNRVWGVVLVAALSLGMSGRHQPAWEVEQRQRGEKERVEPPAAPRENGTAAAPAPGKAPATAGERTGVPSAAEVLARSSQSFREIARRVGPAVVSVESTQPARPASPGQTPRPDLPRFGFPFPFDFPPMLPGPQGPQDPQGQVAMGSAVFIGDKYLVTNHHVVYGAEKIRIQRTGSNTHQDVKLVGSDAYTDLAVLELTEGSAPAVARWADFSQVEVGDWAIAIGSPFGLASTVTVGVVSATGRSGAGVIGSDFIGEFLQTDAAINPGNSGGPLCNIQGEIIGINTAIYSRTGGYQGIGFAIPSNLAQSVVARLIEHGEIVRGWLGVTIQPTTEDLQNQLEIEGGAVVHSVTPRSPAAKAGLEAGDVVVKAGEETVNGPEDLQKVVMNKAPGDSLKLSVISYQSRRMRQVEAKLEKLPERQQLLSE